MRLRPRSTTPNLSKLLDAIEQLKETTQLIVISHQRRTMEQADVLYGVSMQADGVSHVVSQRLDKTTGKELISNGLYGQSSPRSLSVLVRL